MTTHRFICVIALTVITASTGACKTTTVDLNSDPEVSAVRTAFEAGEPIEITGYSRVSDGHRDWKGVVQLAPPDSVQFTARAKKSTTGNRAERARRIESRIARADLASIDIEGYDSIPVAHYSPVGAAPPSVARDPSPPAISVVTTRPAYQSKRGSGRALTIGIFVAVVGAAVVGYAIAGQ